MTVLMVSSAAAQVITEDVIRDAERLQEREAERLRERNDTLSEGQVSAPSGVNSGDTSAVTEALTGCVDVEAANLSGVTLYNPSEYQRQLAELVGVCVPLSSVDDLLRRITNRYVSDGFLTSRALIVSDNLENKILDIVVIEGKLGEIRSEGEKGTRPFGLSEIALSFPADIGKALNLRDLEQGVDQLARLRGVAAKVDIVPASEAGTSDILVKRVSVGSAVRPSFEFSNNGSDFSGRQIGTFVLDLDSPLGLADFWSAFYSRDLVGDIQRGNEAYGGFVSVPWGYTTFSISGSRSQFRSVLESNGLAFSNTGRTYNGSLVVNRLVHRDQNTKVSVSSAFSIFDTETRIQSIRLSTNSYRLVEGKAGLTIQHRGLGGLLSGGVNFSRGLAALGANVVDTGPSGPSRTYRKFDGSLRYTAAAKVATIPFVYRSLFRGQFSLDPLLPAERLNLGGRSTVRGFRIDGTSGRNGVFARNELEFDLFDLFKDDPHGQIINIGLTIGHDVGRIFADNNNIFDQGLLQSSTVSMEMRSRRFRANFSYSIPLSTPFFVERDGAELSISATVTI